MTKFYVEVWQPNGQSAEQFATLDTFKDAVAWLDERLTADPERQPRLRGYTDEMQHTEMLRRGMMPG